MVLSCDFSLVDIIWFVIGGGTRPCNALSVHMVAVQAYTVPMLTAMFYASPVSPCELLWTHSTSRTLTLDSDMEVTR